jgi:hypothetical protein
MPGSDRQHFTAGLRVVRELEIIIARRGRPAMCVFDNGTELTGMGTPLEPGDVALSFLSGLNWSLALKKGPDDEATKAFGRADHRDLEGARGRNEDGRPVPEAQDQRRDLL